MPAQPLPDDLAGALARDAARLGPYANLQYHPEVDSTNDLALALAVAGAEEGTAVLASLQRAGRGRRGRTWHSPPDSGLYLSIVLHPPLVPETLSLVTLAAGVAVATAIRRAVALPVELKWPNDIVIGRPWRKLGGLLAETATTGSRIVGIVMGIGINLSATSYPRELAGRASDIETELGRPIDRAPLIVALLAEMRAIMGRLGRGERDLVRDEWRTLGAAGLAGGHVRWMDGDHERRGRARGIAADGALLVDVGAGDLVRVIAGEVTWESLARE